ncbi:TetR/AcrR family transcriptional regulator [Spongiactinospora sp. TRM90649]|uniref:TetR/AcrR family transcriptional regulator n=1 Tax=Spongiactinospora sp. TRM90649 TaxID=3031114 RepID=UPI0023F63FCF|nr:TetR/AcrR family transcriptional regulator [Spongiactinospora sp. TRM90649]MDF5759132.1 helix-turn-helix domain containing protein [Spongiactinospora sp. TRM90649]
MAPVERRPPEPPSSERGRRAERILDAAAEILASWGYARVTIDDVARRAGVGKGTIYLHFATKEELFLNVVMRSQFRLIARLVEDLRDDPATVLLSDVCRRIYLWAHEDPVIHAVLVRDMETLGALVRTTAELAGDLFQERMRATDAYLAVLREHGLVRDDTPVPLQRHAMAAVITGFLTVEPVTPAKIPEPEECAGALADVIRSSFEISHDPAAMRTAAAEAADIFQRLHERFETEIGGRTSN